ncbi:MAG: CDP-glucose 4,6-dehydratase [Alphaproteobacteria bacterium]|nr:CDP-glucose 4,6-dehydratase [Alphaproteobacteria bacterium]MBU1514473.1 CDP-glucose 4,6-dehydratase [Alphaproteobacteria bacterium]MBU2096895.1 CDP-glucose 4,6-dehydratase [Alphaproteobacteria bacterium]MBU2153522.1 CDP-glucose 4,6-dehydratase [Alphaproteobacteria bacterium]MBU2305973.1 CDP-glucose 4,6-dehydratase [Alphaproteobacteria bacterium]
MAAVNAAFWAGKRVLLTGHTGFKGSWAAIWLGRMGAQVTGIALPPDQAPALFALAGVERRITSRFVDLRNPDAVASAVGGHAFDLVLHMAAQPIVRTSVEDPIGTFETNIMGTAHLLQALRSQGALKAVLAITSDKVYANNETGRAFVEGDNLGGKDPYSASKAATEIIVQSFAKSYFQAVPMGTARGGNVIGGGDFSRDRLVADIVRAARGGEPVVLRHPEATRPWQHVLDCLAGYFRHIEALATDPATPRALNFGPKPGGAEVSVGELATLGVAALGGQAWRHEPDPTSLEAKSLAIDASLARKVLGFESRLDAPEAVALTMDWYRRQAMGEDALALCLEQIEGYESRP